MVWPVPSDARLSWRKVCAKKTRRTTKILGQLENNTKTGKASSADPTTALSGLLDCYAKFGPGGCAPKRSAFLRSCIATRTACSPPRSFSSSTRSSCASGRLQLSRLLTLHPSALAPRRMVGGAVAGAGAVDDGEMPVVDAILDDDAQAVVKGFEDFLAGLCGDRSETAPPRQGAGECRMAAKIWV